MPLADLNVTQLDALIEAARRQHQTALYAGELDKAGASLATIDQLLELRHDAARS